MDSSTRGDAAQPFVIAGAVGAQRRAIDPVIWQAMGNAQRTFDILRTAPGAICCSHSHWDHCHFQTLLWLDKGVPILIPEGHESSMLNPPMAEALRRLGFTDVREVKAWEPVQIEDIEIIPVPFHGEQDEPDFEMDHYTYVVRTAGLSLYGGVDGYRSTNGDMKPVVERVGQAYRPDVAFLPVSKWICHYKSGGVNGFCRYLDQERLEQSFQYTAGPRTRPTGHCCWGRRRSYPMRPSRLRAPDSIGGRTVRRQIKAPRDRAAFLSDASAGFSGRKRSSRRAADAVASLAAGRLVARRRRDLSPGPAGGRGPHVPLPSRQTTHLSSIFVNLFQPAA